MSDSSIGLVIGAIWNPHKLGEYYARIERIYGNEMGVQVSYPSHPTFPTVLSYISKDVFLKQYRFKDFPNPLQAKSLWILRGASVIANPIVYRICKVTDNHVTYEDVRYHGTWTDEKSAFFRAFEPYSKIESKSGLML